MERHLVLQQIKESVLTTDPTATLILYGSVARGDSREDSDIDVLVLLDKEKVTVTDRQRISYPLYHMALENDIIISPNIFSKNTWATVHSITPFYKNVVREGIVL